MKLEVDSIEASEVKVAPFAFSKLQITGHHRELLISCPNTVNRSWLLCSDISTDGQMLLRAT